jgi:hypothetical protein
MPPTLSFLRHRYEICEAITMVEMENTKNFVTQWPTLQHPNLLQQKKKKKEVFNPKPTHMMPTRLGICEGRSNA